jgi:hypothetical protein
MIDEESDHQIKDIELLIKHKYHASAQKHRARCGGLCLHAGMERVSQSFSSRNLASS